MNVAVDSKPPVNLNNQNGNHDSSNVVMLSTAGESGSGKTFKQLLTDGEDQSSAKTITHKHTDKTPEQKNDGVNSLPEESSETVVRTLPEPDSDYSQDPVDSIVLANGFPSDFVKRNESPALLNTSIDITVNMTEGVLPVASGIQSELTKISDPHMLDLQSNKIQSGLIDTKSLQGQGITPLTVNTDISVVTEEAAIPVIPIVVSAPVLTAPTALTSVDDNTGIEGSVTDVMVQMDKLSTELSPEVVVATEELPLDEIEQTLVHTLDSNLSRAVAGKTDNIEVKEFVAPVVSGVVSEALPLAGKRQQVAPVFLSNGVAIENPTTGLVNDGQRIIQPAPASAADANFSLPGLTTGNDVSSGLRISSPGLLDGSRSQGLDGMSQTAGNHIKMMMEQGISRATVQLNPADLGSMRINIDLKSDQLNVQISVVQGNTREALESALPRLRAQLEADGYSGINIDLEQGGTGDNNSSSMNNKDRTLDYYPDTEMDMKEKQEFINDVAIQGTRSLVDLFA